MERPSQCFEPTQPLRLEVLPVDAISLLLLDDDDDVLMAPELLGPDAFPSANDELQVMEVHETMNVTFDHGNGSMKKNAGFSKEEKEQLLDEVATLETLATVLKTREEGKQRMLTEKDIYNAMLRQASRSQQLYVASAQSGISGLLASDPTNPLSTFIRLGTDWDERRRTLSAMRDLKIRQACEYVSARSLALDPLKPYFSDERFENDNGDYSCVRYQTVQFHNAKSVRQVYDALLSYMHNMEISISEWLGRITVREYDSMEQSIANYRLLTTESGVLVESNNALFLKYFDAHELSNGAPCGVITTDFVDEDRLHPYSPHNRLRKDITATAVLTPHVHVKPNGDEELVVTMSRAAFVTLHHAEFAVRSDAIENVREELARWGDVMVTSINESIRSNV
uniref:Uncharacterized protein n=1 Tax=Globisporangium ultimum (strain ATCC 200006 / CBS 805.95 / DAOM BR144) TaxID=431595 RepID=K3X386_GLOUD